ncbi:MAG: phosphoenolpyruvate synthase regulatory protein [Gammaproteobacteria bacterium]|nr:MAG: phosphoenolpyruvate synthase regulatory protein [Gammaproteobacteria bacterium]
MKRTAFFISDGTGITAEGIGQALLAQFEGIEFEKITLPYIDTPTKARTAVESINKAGELDLAKPIIFETIVDRKIRREFAAANAFMVDTFGAFLAPLERELDTQPSHEVGKSHSINQNLEAYERRMSAVNYTMDNDDGGRTRLYDQADLILIGISRTGKTPTCLYLALQYGLKAANYPITEEDIEDQRLPVALQPHRKKLFGLTIDPERLACIRNERKANSKYSSIKQCNYEVEEVELMYRRERIPFLNTTFNSIEEIATHIMARTGIDRRVR